MEVNNQMKELKYLVIHVNGSEKLNNLHHDHDYILPDDPPKTKLTQAKKTKKELTKKSQLKAIYNCQICGYKSMQKDLHNKHMITHKKSKPKKAQYIQCADCDDATKAPDGYEKCPHCSFYTKNKTSLKVHMNIHSNGTPYKCTECNYSGKDLKELIVHYSGIKDLSCELCDYRTHVRRQMATHKLIHMDEKPYACGICNFSTKSSPNLYRHMKIHKQT